MKVTGPIELINGLGPSRWILNRPLGPDVVTNGAFSADTNWNKGDGWSIGSGVATNDGSQSANSLLAQAPVSPVTAGKLYRTEFTITLLTGTGAQSRPIVGGSGTGTFRGATGTYVENIVCAGFETVYIQCNDWTAATGDLSVDNYSVREIY